ncbi:ABL126Wp [Eremothecium gossypii ATCC 10895]|uniref:phosphopentomutase n=1 Tax=Eremothecium gossypii (strain ATCC 10895 / CBS 109.51 / FGSC 9923 / NRRL Y-1056) TaxID=284811 RepID=Q75DZ9_EREGS|nr:ABL126Wp [Eremothecium gossypii ATCC 10895]AAS50645.1 ABL126Wp [Eremothecium gossypii ATCC 10895]AEY94933.1 FABL126Wp [Eremothecium gossypii FDAG1]
MKENTDAVPSSLKDSLMEWLTFDKNSETQHEICELVSNHQWDELRKRLLPRITFGTAGLRARMEAGFSRMNTLTVIQASQGLARYIKSQFPDDLKVVIGHDHRFHSREFAEATIAAFLQLDYDIYYLNYVPPGSDEDVFVHTPMVPFAINNVEGGPTSCGVMITASHNPKMDNGYKVYYANGCQIIPPHDELIGRHIDANLEPWTRAWDSKALIEEAIKSGKLHDVRKEMLQKYKDSIQTMLVKQSNLKFAGGPWFVYTPMHGVGYEFFKEAVASVLGIEEDKDYIVVPEQKYPDPEFPTVSFPNPEERGALDMAMKVADANGITVVLANDPDADRFSVAVKYHGEWNQLTGNQIGILFAQAEMQSYFKEPKLDRKQLAMLTSAVSSQLLRKMAEEEGFLAVETLTGFKWLGNRARELELEGYYVPFAYEEAIGYMFSQVVHDKDGIAAAAVFLQMCYEWKKVAKSSQEVLQECYEKYGYFVDYNGYYISSAPAVTKEVFDYFRNEYTPAGKPYPSHIGCEFEVEYLRDLTVGYQSDTATNIPDLPVDHNSQMITCVLKPVKMETDCESVRFTARGSGTEPKLKVYIESCAANHQRASHLSHLAWDVLKREWFRPTETGLQTNF